MDLIKVLVYMLINERGAIFDSFNFFDYHIARLIVRVVINEIWDIDYVQSLTIIKTLLRQSNRRLDMIAMRKKKFVINLFALQATFDWLSRQVSV